jgi:hypothetical protein
MAMPEGSMYLKNAGRPAVVGDVLCGVDSAHFATNMSAMAASI